MLHAEQMRSLPQCFTIIADPRRAQGQRDRLHDRSRESVDQHMKTWKRDAHIS